MAKYIMRNADGGVAIHESNDKVYRAGDPVDGCKVVSLAVSDWFTERFWSLVEEEFFDFQSENGIESGDVPFDLDSEMHEAVDSMVLAMAKAKAWQLANLTEAK